MTLYRCQNLACAEGQHAENNRCIFDFESDRPVCPKCGGDQRKNKNAVLTLVVIHFEEEAGTLGNIAFGKKELACKPGEPIKGTVHRSSGAKAVTCPACRKTEAWRKAMEEQGEVLEDKDYPVEVTADGHRKVEPAAAPAVAERPAG